MKKNELAININVKDLKKSERQLFLYLAAEANNNKIFLTNIQLAMALGFSIPWINVCLRSLENKLKITRDYIFDANCKNKMQRIISLK